MGFDWPFDEDWMLVEQEGWDGQVCVGWVTHAFEGVLGLARGIDCDACAVWAADLAF